jgi:sec-independent protein translocase protein TatA
LAVVAAHGRRSTIIGVALAFLEGPDGLIVLLIVLVLFGGSKVPQLARSLGEAKHEFEAGMRGSPRTPDASASESNVPTEEVGGTQD